jgi:hypothetical protein
MLHCLAFLVVLLTGCDALADEVRFRLTNGTSYPIRALVLSQSDIAAWGPNVLSLPSIKPGDTREILVRGGIVDCNVDLKAAFDTNASEPIWKYLNLCNLKMIRLNFDQMSGVATASYEE